MTLQMQPRQKKKKKKKLNAQNANKHMLYEASVQNPEADIKFCDRVYRRAYDKSARVMREDFCGTAALSCEWVRTRPENTAIGVDFDTKVLHYGRKNHLSTLGPDESRVELFESDVLDFEGPKVDVVASLNFSYFTFKSRAVMLRYFEVVRRSLNPEGVFVMDIMGGPEAQVPQEEDRDNEGFTYVWDQHAYNPITGDFKCYIHFRFPDGSEMRRAFTYDWRLWSVPELHDILTEAGFRAVNVYWEGSDEDGEGNGVFRLTRSGDDSDAWIAYVVALP